MNKLFKYFWVLLTVILCCVGCGQPLQTTADASQSKDITTTNSSEMPSVSSAVWETLSGEFTRNDSSQYNNASLQMKYLSNDCVMFEFRLMEGSESQDWADTLILPFVLLVDDNGVGHYESDADAINPINIDFLLSEDGQQITVTHTGDVSISPDGIYDFVNEGLEVSECSATAILDHLPTAATSLNSNNGAYTIQYPDALVSDWFYPVEATFDDNGVALAKFIIAKDLSVVYRVDDDIDPVLIFGTAQPMLDAETIHYNEIDEEESYETLPLVSVGLEDGIALTPGTTTELLPIMPWKLPYTLTAESSDPSVVTVDENGKVTAIAEGQATLSGTLYIDDGQKAFSIDVIVSGELEFESVDIE
ncbi:MAG: Ig-like domain-containing protein [Sedimentibacter sp.]